MAKVVDRNGDLVAEFQSLMDVVDFKGRKMTVQMLIDKCGCKVLSNMALYLILDESGSMGMIRDATISGVNEYTQGLRDSLHGHVVVTVIAFNSQARVIHEAVELAKLPAVSVASYVPSGSTSLLDAVGLAMDQGEMIAPQFERILALIVTDGQENSSTKFTKATLATRMKLLEGGGKWTFAYIGANVDVWSEGMGMGMSRGNVAAYVASDRGTNMMYQQAKRATMNYTVSKPTEVVSAFWAGSDTADNINVNPLST